MILKYMCVYHIGKKNNHTNIDAALDSGEK